MKVGDTRYYNGRKVEITALDGRNNLARIKHRGGDQKWVRAELLLPLPEAPNE